MFEGDCVVYYFFWLGDGGILDICYIFKCLLLFLLLSVNEFVYYDVIIFNFGFYDVDCCNFLREVN